MNKAKIISLAAMTDEQVKEDMKMTPLERITLAFQISDFALEIGRSKNASNHIESNSIQWIELRKLSK